MKARSIRLLLPALLFCLVLPRGARAQSCEHEARRTATSAMSGVERVHVVSHSGSLEVRGVANATTASASGIACASSADLLDDLRIEARRSGSTLIIEATHPDDGFRMGRTYARIDMVVQVPLGTAAIVEDGSGDVELAGLGATRLEDGSGNVIARDLRGDFIVDDGSGNVEITGVAGSVEIDDGSGDIVVEDVRGSVAVDDGSGDIRIRRVGGSVRIGDDGSGDIRVSEVTRDVLIDEDGSGSVYVDDVGGDFVVRDDGSGTIRHTGVRGRVDVPRSR